MEIRRDTATYIKAVGIMLVLMGHGSAALTSCNITMIKMAGSVGVALFLFMSGYGLTESYKNNASVSVAEWCRKRIGKVMIPFWIMMLIQSIYLWVKGDRIPVTDWVLSVVGIVDYDTRLTVDSTMWYITFMLFWYAVFLILFILCDRVIKKDGIKVILICAIAVLGYTFKIELVPDWSLNYFSFVFGIMFSFFRESIGKIFVAIVSGIGLTGMILSGIRAYQDCVPRDVYLLIYVYSCMIVFVALPCIICGNKKVPVLSKAIAFIGDASYEIYLVEGFILLKFMVNIASIGNAERFVVFTLISVLAGIIFHYVYGRVNLFIKNL